MTGSIDHTHLLAPERTAQDDTLALSEGRLVDIEFIRVDSALHDVLAKAVDAGDEDDISKTGPVSSVKITPLEAWSALTIFMISDRERDFEMVEPVVDFDTK